MSRCEDCKYAVWDYEEYYGGAKRWFVDDCKKCNSDDDGECDDFEEVEE